MRIYLRCPRCKCPKVHRDEMLGRWGNRRCCFCEEEGRREPERLDELLADIKGRIEEIEREVRHAN
jgi:hypothetical protein